MKIERNEFKLFSLNEEKVYLGTKVGDILTALQQLNGDSQHMGKRHLIRLIKNIVRQIRRIINTNWTFEETRHLEVLQKVGVALMKGLDTNQDLVELIGSCTNEMEQLSDKIGEPINNLGAPSIDRDNSEADSDD